MIAYVAAATQASTLLSNPSSGQCPCHRLTALLLLAENYNWCIVDDKGHDAILFASLAVVIACMATGRLQSLIVLIIGKLRLRSLVSCMQTQ